MRRDRRLASLSSLISALLVTLALAACSSSDPTSGTSTTSTTTAGAGGGGGQGGTGGEGAGTFACKTDVCEAGKEQCAVDAKDEGACFPLPKGCLQTGATKPTCVCFTDLPADCMCQQDPKGNFVVQCTMM